MPRWHLTPAAELDLETIWINTATRWGARQAERYVDGLFEVFALLADFPEMARERAEFTPPVRLHPHKSHSVIYVPSDEGLDIIRIFHMRQDFWAILDR